MPRVKSSKLNSPKSTSLPKSLRGLASIKSNHGELSSESHDVLVDITNRTIGMVLNAVKNAAVVGSAPLLPLPGFPIYIVVAVTSISGLKRNALEVNYVPRRKLSFERRNQT